MSLGVTWPWVRALLDLVVGATSPSLSRPRRLPPGVRSLPLGLAVAVERSSPGQTQESVHRLTRRTARPSGRFLAFATGRNQGALPPLPQAHEVGLTKVAVISEHDFS